MAMYVDKKLSGVATVQTLSRLNRIYPGKTAPMVVDFRNTPASVQEDFKLYYSDAHVEGDVDPNALYTIGERLDTADFYTREEMDAVADAFLAEAGGEAIAKALSPIKNRWSRSTATGEAVARTRTRRRSSGAASAPTCSLTATPGSSSARSSTTRTPSCTAARSSRRCWRATSTPTANDYDDSYLEGVQLSGVKLVPSAIKEDHSLSEGSGEGIKLPGFDGEHKSAQHPAARSAGRGHRQGQRDVPGQGGRREPGERRRASSRRSGASSTRTRRPSPWRRTTPSRSSRRPKDSAARSASRCSRRSNESKEIQSYMTDPAFIEQIADIAADALHAQQVHGDAGSVGRGRGVGVMGEPEPAGFGDVIREARKKQGWSQAELGEKAGVSRPDDRAGRGEQRRHDRDHRQDRAGTGPDAGAEGSGLTVRSYSVKVPAKSTQRRLPNS